MKRWHVDGILLVIVMLWGSTFFVVRGATDGFPPITLVALRFSLATIAMLPWAFRSMRTWTRQDWIAGSVLGLILTVGYISQTMGIARTTASRAGFITGLNVIMVPLMVALVWRTRVRRQVWVGVLLTVLGLYILSRPPDDQVAVSSLLGDSLVFICAVFFAIHIIAIGYWTRKCSLVAMNIIQMGVVAVASAPIAVIFEQTTTIPSSVWWSAAYLGVICTAFLLAIQMMAQRHASPTHTALIFVLEPVFAALFAAMFGGEKLTQSLIWGGLVMLMGIVLAELPPLFRAKGREQRVEAEG